MNNSKKNNKKIIIIVGIIIVMLLGCLLLILNDKNGKKSNEKVTINCSFSKNLEIMDISISLKANYENEVFQDVHEEYEIKLLNDNLIQNIDKIKEAYDQEFKNKFGKNVSNYSIEKKEESIVITLDVTADEYEIINNEAKESVGDTSINSSKYHYGYKNLHEHVKGLGGECEYE